MSRAATDKQEQGVGGDRRDDLPRVWSGDVGVGVRAWAGELPPDEEQAGPDADPESVARKILLDALTGQARSRRELRDKLAKKAVPPELTERLLDRFAEVGLVDDEAFARSWVESRQRSRGLARRALAQELRRKGVDDETARTALDELDPQQEERAARALVRKKLRSLGDVDHTTATRRLAGLLARKGYPAGVAFAVVREELARAGRDGLEDDALPE
jgi:regulatory protein